MPTSEASRLARLEERADGIRRELDRLTRQVDAFGPLAGQVIEVIAEVRGLTDDVVGLKSRGMSTTVKVSLITGCFVLAAALVAAVAQIVSGVP